MGEASDRSNDAWARAPFTASVLGLAYLALALPLLRPGPARLATHFMADHNDGFQNVWNLWWVKTAILGGRWPWWTDRLFVPDGVPLYFHTLAVTTGVLSIPLQWLFPLPVAHNLVVIATFVLGGLTMYGLARSLGADREAAFIAGAIYTFSPFHFAHGIGHLQLMPIFWLPLYGWALLRACRRPAPGRVAVAALTLLLTALTDHYFALYAGLGTLLVVIWRRTLQTPALVLALATVGSLPVTVPMAWAYLRIPLVGAHDPVQFSADLLGWLVPGEVSAWSRLTQPFWSRFTGAPSENGVYLGVVPLAIVAAALRAGIHGLAAYVTGAAIFAVLALGPWLHIAGHVTAIPLPYLALETLIPPLRLGGLPVRFTVMVYLCLSLAVSTGLTGWWAAWPRRRRRLAFAALLAGLLVDYAPRPYTTTSAAAPVVVQELGHDPDRAASVLDLPADHMQTFSRAMFHQTIHGKPLVGGFIARYPKGQLETFAQHPVIVFLYASPTCTEATRHDMHERLRRDRTRWILLRQGVPDVALARCLDAPRTDRDGLTMIGPLPGGTGG